MILEVQALYVLLRSNALLARSNFHDYCRNFVAVAISGILLGGVAVLLYRYSNHERCQRLKRLSEEVFGYGSGSLENRSTRSIQSLWRRCIKRRSYVKRRQASVVIQRRIRGIIVRSILCGNGLPTLARAVVQEDGVQQRAAATEDESSSLNNTSLTISTSLSARQDCRILIAAFNQEEEEERCRAQANATTKDQSSMQFGTQVKAVMEVRMRLLAAVVLQSWFRMIKCRLGYQKVFSSLNTAPITNMPSIASPRRQDTQENISFISSLSSWSSTWNKLQPPAFGTPSAFFGGADSSTGMLAFRPTKEEKEALKHSIKDYASAYASIEKLQAWWRGTLVRLRIHRDALKTLEMNVLSDGALSTPEEEAPTESQKGRREQLANSGSDNTVPTSNMSICKDSFPGQRQRDQQRRERQRKPSPGPRRSSRYNNSQSPRRRRRRSNPYYAEIFQNTLERMGECQTMCNGVIDTAASMEFTKKAANVGKTIYEDPTNYDLILNKVNAAADEIPSCSSLPKIVAEAGQKHIDEGGCKWEQEILNTTRSSAMEIVDKITTWQRKKARRRRGSSGGKNDRSRDSHLYYVPTDMIDVEPLSPGATAMSSSPAASGTLSSPPASPQHTLSSPVSSYTNQSCGTDEETSQQSSEARSRNRRKQTLIRGLCAAPVPTSMISSSSDSSSDSRDVGSYYSIDDTDVRDDDDEVDDDDDDSRYQGTSSDAKSSSRKPRGRDRRSYPLYEDDDDEFSFSSFLQL